MLKHFEPFLEVIDTICFWHQGRKYEGHGFLEWEHAKGVDISVHAKRVTGKLPSTHTVTMKPYVLEYTTLRMHLRSRRIALALAPVHLDFLEEATQNRCFVQIHADTIVFIDRQYRAKPIQQWYGTCLLHNSSRALMPHTVNSKEWIEGEQPAEGFSMAGLLFESEDLYLRGIRLDTSTLEFQWHHPSTPEDAKLLRRWPSALRDAMTLITSDPTALDRVELLCGTRRRHELFRRWPVRSLITEPFIPGNQIIDCGHFIRLATFLASGSREAKVASQIVNQVVEAFQLPSRRANEITITTVLEASLRTLFEDKARRWSAKAEVERFRAQYGLGDDWIAINKVLVKVWNRLRTDGAHPNWIDRFTRRESSESLRRVLVYRSYLIRYYGFMIRAMSGEEDLAPLFPELPK